MVVTDDEINRDRAAGEEFINPFSSFPHLGDVSRVKMWNFEPTSEFEKIKNKNTTSFHESMEWILNPISNSSQLLSFRKYEKPKRRKRK
jgi:hypothetical protein